MAVNENEIAKNDQETTPEPAPEKEKAPKKTKKDPAAELRSVKRELGKLKREYEELNEELNISRTKSEHLFEELKRYKVRLEEVEQNKETAKRILFDSISNALNAFNNAK